MGYGEIYLDHKGNPEGFADTDYSSPSAKGRSNNRLLGEYGPVLGQFHRANTLHLARAAQTSKNKMKGSKV